MVSFTSHGAMVDVSLPGGGALHCYIPLTAMGTPPPTKARQVLKKGELRPFVLAGLDPPRRVAELALPAPAARVEAAGEQEGPGADQGGTGARRPGQEGAGQEGAGQAGEGRRSCAGQESGRKKASPAKKAAKKAASPAKKAAKAKKAPAKKAAKARPR